MASHEVGRAARQAAGRSSVGVLVLLLALHTNAAALPVTTDLFDIAQGTTVDTSSGAVTIPALSGFDHRDMFGGTFSTGEPGNAIFNVQPGTNPIYYIEFVTGSPVTVGSFALYAGHDGGPNFCRSFQNFRLLACTAAPCSAGTTTVLYDQPVTVPYVYVGLGNLVAQAAVTPTTAQRFRAEYKEGSNCSLGPRVIELDAFAPLPTTTTSSTTSTTSTTTTTTTSTTTTTTTTTSTTTTTVVVLDHYVMYQAKASTSDDKFPTQGWNIQLDDVTLPNTEADDPENYIVKKEKSLVLPAMKNVEPGPSDPVLHYLRYQVKEATEGAGPYDPVRQKYPKAVKHVKRRWQLQNQFGTITVESKKVEAMWVPTAKSLVAQPPAPADHTHFLCYQVKETKDITDQTPDPGNGKGKLRKDMQAFFGDQFLDVDCVLDRDGNVAFENTPAEGKCLFDLKKPKALCNPVVKSTVGGTPPRVTLAGGIPGSTPAITDESLLCYQVKLSTKLVSQDVIDAGLLAGLVPPAAVGQRLKQTKHVKRELKSGTAVFTTPGNDFPDPERVNTKKTEFVCLPTVVNGVAPLP